MRQAGIHSLSNQTSSGLSSKTHQGHVDVGFALQAAGNAVLGAGIPMSSRDPATHADGVPAASAVPVATGNSLAGRMRELADLHGEGILSDEEYAAAKATLLGQL